MAQKFLTSIDLNGQQILNANLQNLATDPPGATAGRIYFHTGSGKARLYTGSVWIEIPSDGSITNVAGTGPIQVSVTGGVATVSIDAATTSSAGSMSAADKTKLNAITATGSGSIITASERSAVTALKNGSTIQHKLDATADPTATSDSGAGYSVGSIWVNVTSDEAFIALDVTTSAAVWNKVTAGVASEIGITAITGVTGSDVQAALSSLKTLIDGKAATSHTHTSSNVTDFHTAVRTSRLDQMAAPTAPVGLGSQRITGLAPGTAGTDAVNKNQLDAAAQGTVGLAPSKAATTANITLSGLQTIDGYSVQANDRILVKDQSSASQNGIYVAAAGAWTRAADADEPSELKTGNYSYVENGTDNANTTFAINTTGTIVIGTTAITWTILAKAGDVVGGNGLTKTGTTIAVGAGNGISVTADAVQVDPSVVVRKFAASVGNASLTSFSLNHNLNTRDVSVQVYETASPYAQVYTDVEATDLNNVTVRFSTAPTSNQYRVVIHG